MSGKPTFEDLSAFVDGELTDVSGTVRADLKNDGETAALLAKIGSVDDLVCSHYQGEADRPVPDHLVAAIHSGFEKHRARHKQGVWSASWLPIAASLLIAVFGLVGAFYVAEQRAEKQIAAYEMRWKAGQRALEAALQDALETNVSGTEVSFASGEADRPVPDHLVAAIDRGFKKRRVRHKQSVWSASWLPIAASLLIAAFGLAGAFYVAEQRAETQIAAYEARWKAGQRALETALQDALETKASGAEVSFASGQADIQGRISPTRTYRSRTGHWCREFSEVIESGGVREHRHGLACREDSGGWQRLETTISGNPGFRLTR